MGNFEKAIKGHDWSFQYSDDHRVWVRGCRSQDRVRELHKALKCPFSYLELENFAINRARISGDKFDEIAAWLCENDAE